MHPMMKYGNFIEVYNNHDYYIHCTSIKLPYFIISPGNTICSKFTIIGNLLWCNIKNNNEIIY